jgi:hypothetical protein
MISVARTVAPASMSEARERVMRVHVGDLSEEHLERRDSLLSPRLVLQGDPQAVSSCETSCITSL